MQQDESQVQMRTARECRCNRVTANNLRREEWREMELRSSLWKNYGGEALWPFDRGVAQKRGSLVTASRRWSQSSHTCCIPARHFEREVGLGDGSSSWPYAVMGILELRWYCSQLCHLDWIHRGNSFPLPLNAGCGESVRRRVSTYNASSSPSASYS